MTAISDCGDQTAKVSNESGASFNYTRYFEKRRNKLFKKRKTQANEFIEHLEIAIIVSVRMTGGEISKLLNLRRISKSQQCNVCHTIVFDEDQRSIQYFQAKKVCDTQKPSGFNLEWTREEFNSAKQISETQWLSGPLVLCKECVGNVIWCETHVKLKNVESNIHKNKFDQLPKVCSLYYSLQKSLHLGKFFEEQTKLLLRDQKKNAIQLSEMRNCIANCSTEIGNIGLQISKVGQNDPVYSKMKPRETIIQRNIWQYSVERSWDLQFLMASIDSDHSDIKAEKHIEDEHKEWAVLKGFKRAICYPVHLADSTINPWHNKK